MEKLQCENEAILVGRCFAMQFEGESNLTASQKLQNLKLIAFMVVGNEGKILGKLTAWFWPKP